MPPFGNPFTPSDGNIPAPDAADDSGTDSQSSQPDTDSNGGSPSGTGGPDTGFSPVDGTPDSSAPPQDSDTDTGGDSNGGSPSGTGGPDTGFTPADGTPDSSAPPQDDGAQDNSTSGGQTGGGGTGTAGGSESTDGSSGSGDGGGDGLVAGAQSFVTDLQEADQQARNKFREIREGARDTFRDVTNTENIADTIQREQAEGVQQTREAVTDAGRIATGDDVDRGVLGDLQNANQQIKQQMADSNVKTGPGPVLAGFSGRGVNPANLGDEFFGAVRAARGGQTIQGAATGEQAASGAVRSGEFVVEGTNKVADVLKAGSVAGTAGLLGSETSEIPQPENPNADQTELDPQNPNQQVSELDPQNPSQQVSEVDPAVGESFRPSELDVTDPDSVDDRSLQLSQQLIGGSTDGVEFDEDEIREREREERNELARQGQEQQIYEQRERFGEIERDSVPEFRDERRGDFQKGQDIQDQSQQFFESGESELTPYQRQVLRGRQGNIGDDASETGVDDLLRDFETGESAVVGRGDTERASEAFDEFAGSRPAEDVTDFEFGSLSPDTVQVQGGDTDQDTDTGFNFDAGGETDDATTPDQTTDPTDTPPDNTSDNPTDNPSQNPNRTPPSTGNPPTTGTPTTTGNPFDPGTPDEPSRQKPPRDDPPEPPEPDEEEEEDMFDVLVGGETFSTGFASSEELEDEFF